MPRTARIVVPTLPHHVTQRGNRRQPIFFEDGDYALYRDLLAERCERSGVACWAYCLMPNHVHLVLVPTTEDGLASVLGETHRRYTTFINARARWTGHLFQGRFGSAVMDEEHLVAATRYLSLNPVRAGLAKQAADWRWSSVRAHLAGKDDRLVRVRPLLDRVDAFADLVSLETGEMVAHQLVALRMSETSGRPLGNASFLEQLEAALGRSLRPGRRGRKPRCEANVPKIGER
ncbi:MAG: transposase [Hyphomicrobiales bacterium]|nr:transposase [Hyphomicrobiales bacterium]